MNSLLTAATVTFAALALTGTAHAADDPVGSAPAKTQNIINGYTPHASQWPWMAAVGYSQSANPTLTGYQRHFCGGTLIAPRVVITAAHCVVRDEGVMAAGELGVALGRRHLNATGGEDHQVMGVVVHPSYSTKTFRNDVALLLLASPSAQPPAALDSGLRLSEGHLATVMGWGYDRNNGQRTEDLRAVDVALWSSDHCVQAYADFAWKHQPDVMLCAGWNDGGTNTCKGDSGGPLMIPDSAGTWRLIGLVSWADECAKAGRPTNFTYVNAATNRDWIATTTQTLIRAGDTQVPLPVATPMMTPAPATTAAPTPISTPTPTPTRVNPAAAISRLSATGRLVRFTLDRAGKVTIVVTLRSGTRTYTAKGSAGRNVVRLPRLNGARRVTVSTRAGADVRRVSTRVR